MKLLVDMNLSPRWIGFLAGAGFEAIHWSDVGPPDAPDEILLGWAAENGRVLLTSDLDFGAILAATGGRRPSVVQVRSDRLDPEAIGPLVVAGLGEADAALAAGALVSIEPGRARIRVLPLGRTPDDAPTAPR